MTTQLPPTIRLLEILIVKGGQNIISLTKKMMLEMFQLAPTESNILMTASLLS